MCALLFSEFTPCFVAVLSVLGWILYRYYTSTFNHWKNKNVPYIKPLVFFGNLKDRITFKISFHELQLDLYKKLDGHALGGIFEGRRPKLLLRDPELIRRVMVRDFDHFIDRATLNIRKQEPYVDQLLLNLKGKRWKLVRSLMTPAFSSGKMKSMFQMVDMVGLQMMKYLEKLNNQQKKTEDTTSQYSEKSDTTGDSSVLDANLVLEKEIEMKELFGRYTFDVIASCAFGVHSDSLLQPDAEFVRVVSQFDQISIYMRMLIFLVIMGNSWLLRFFTLKLLNPTALSFLVSILKNTKLDREEGKQNTRNDFLQLMVDAKSGGHACITGMGNEKGTKENKENENEELSPQKVLTDDLVISQCLLFLLAGYETSSTLLTFAAYELALNPEIQDEARKEILAVLDHHKKITYESLNEMIYLEMILLETLRKHPPVARIDRECVRNYTCIIPSSGDEKEKHVHIEKGTTLYISVMGLHYDPKYFPEPYRFRPERFSPEEKAKRSPYVFQGFGHGPRNCLGMRFALMSTKLVMVHLLRHYKLARSPKTEEPYEYNKFSLFLKTKNGIWLKVIKIA